MTSDGAAQDSSAAGETGSRVERFQFTKASVGTWQDPEGRHRNWPVVYTLNNKAEVYTGESLNAVGRMRQHLESSEKKGLDAVRIVIDDTYNKSVCLDLESFLIRMFSGDGRYQVLNRNDGVTNATTSIAAHIRRRSRESLNSFALRGCSPSGSPKLRTPTSSSCRHSRL